jgi:hypothetical protein
MRISTISLLARGPALSACLLYFEQDPDDGAGDTDPGTLAGLAKSPGYPFEVAYYQQVMWPLTQRSCGSGGCHAPGGCSLTGAAAAPESRLAGILAAYDAGGL